MRCSVYDQAGFCPECYANVRGRTNRKGHIGYKAGWDSRTTGGIPMKEEQGGNGHVTTARVAPEPVAFWSKFPALYHQLTDSAFDSGKPRVTSTLLVFGEGDFWKGSLHDRQYLRTAFRTGDGWEDLIRSFNEALEAGRMDWRPDRKNRR